MVDLTTWEIFFVGGKTLIGKRQANRADILGADLKVLGHTDPSPEYGEMASPIYEMMRAPSDRGIATMVHPVAWFPIIELNLPADVMSVRVADLPPEDRRGLARAVEKAEEMLQQMRLSGMGIVPVREVPK